MDKKRHFSTLSAACARFMLGKTSLASSYVCFMRVYVHDRVRASVSGLLDPSFSSKNLHSFVHSCCARRLFVNQEPKLAASRGQ